MARARKYKATTRKSAKKAAAGRKKPMRSRRHAPRAKARLAVKAARRKPVRKAAARPKPAGRKQAGKRAASPLSRRMRQPEIPKNEFWKVNALITAEIEKIGAGIASREAIELNGNGNKQRPMLVRTAQTILKNKVGLELKLLETEIKSGRMKVPEPKEEDDF